MRKITSVIYLVVFMCLSEKSRASTNRPESPYVDESMNRTMQHVRSHRSACLQQGNFVCDNVFKHETTLCKTNSDNPNTLGLEQTHWNLYTRKGKRLYIMTDAQAVKDDLQIQDEREQLRCSITRVQAAEALRIKEQHKLLHAINDSQTIEQKATAIEPAVTILMYITGNIYSFIHNFIS